MKTPLYAPAWYWNLPLKERQKGRCGAGDGIGEKIVPDNILGLNIRPCCQIHDQMYGKGKIHEDKKEADRVFYYNMLRVINGESSWQLKRLRKAIAVVYYGFVYVLGGPAFWDNKNKSDEWGLVDEEYEEETA